MTTTPPETATAQQTVAGTMGEICWLMSQSPAHKHLFMADLDWFVAPALLLGTYRIFRDPQKPIGVALWGKVSPEVLERLNSGILRLHPAEWNSGEIVRLIDLVAPFGHTDAMIADLKSVVPGIEIGGQGA
jgi:cytolysin-activating lysine-acyltransferase